MAFLSRLVLMIQFASVAIKCIDYCSNKTGEMLPNDPYYFLGEEIHVTCRVNDPKRQFLPGYSWNASLLYFTNLERYSNYIKLDENGTLVFSKIADEDDLKYFQSISTLLIHCKINKMEENNTVGCQFIKIERRPQNLTDQEVSCQWWNWRERIDCHWPMPYIWKNDMSVNASMIYMYGDGGTMQQCNVDDSISSCSISNNDVKIELDGANYMLKLNIFNNRKSYLTTNWVYFTRNENVKLQPIAYIKQNYTNSASRLQLSWGFDKNFLYIRSINYHVKIVSLSPWIYPEEVQEFFHEGTSSSFEVDGLHPFSDYNVTISSQPPESKYRSDPFSTKVTTDQEVPGAPPLIMPGSYAMDTSQTCSSGQNQSYEIHVFWQKIPEFFQHSKILKYVVTAIPEQKPNQTVTVEGEEYTTSCSLHLPCGYDYMVNVRAASVKGLSENASQITIRSINGVAIRSSNIVVEFDDKGDGMHKFMNISWPLEEAKRNQIHGYRIFYRQWIRISNQTLKWEDVAHNQSSIIIPFNTSDLDGYGFGVSVIESKGTATGFEFQTCFYYKNREPPKIEQISVEPIGSNALKVSWKAIECDRSREIPVIEIYEVLWCRSSGNVCLDDVKSERVKKESLQSPTIVLPNLKRDERYRIQMQAISKQEKRGDMSDPVFEVATDNTLTTGQILGIVFGGLFLLSFMIAGVSLCFRKSYKIVKGGMKPPEIFVPNPLKGHVEDTEVEFDHDSGKGDSTPSSSGSLTRSTALATKESQEKTEKSLPDISTRIHKNNSQIEHSRDFDLVVLGKTHQNITLGENSPSNSETQSGSNESTSICVQSKNAYIQLGKSDRSEQSDQDTKDSNYFSEESIAIAQTKTQNNCHQEESHCEPNEKEMTDDNLKKDCLPFNKGNENRTEIDSNAFKDDSNLLSDKVEDKKDLNELICRDHYKVIKNKTSYIKLGDSSENSNTFHDTKIMSGCSCNESELEAVERFSEGEKKSETLFQNHFCDMDSEEPDLP